MKRPKLMAIVIKPNENTPQRAIFWRLRNFKRLIMKKGRMNTISQSVMDANSE